MATIIAYEQFSLFDVDLGSYYQNLTSYALLPDSYLTVGSKVYEDVAVLNALFWSGPFSLVLGGFGLTFDLNDNITGGTVTGIYEIRTDTSSISLSIENISVSAVAVFNSYLTPSTADEFALVVNALSGNDVVQLSNYDDIIATYGGNDVIDGFDGDDYIDPGSGVDVVRAGRGNDTVRLSSVSSGFPDSSLDGGSGYDTLDFSVAGSFLSFSSAGQSTDFFTVADNVATSFERIVGGSGGNSFSLSGLSAAVELVGGRGVDTFWNATAAGDTFFGLGGNDSFYVSRGDRAFGGDDADDFFVSGSFGTPATTGIVDGGLGYDVLKLNIQFIVDLAAGTASSGSATYAISGIEEVQAAAQYGYATSVLGSERAEILRVNPLFNDGSAAMYFDGRGGDDWLTGSQGGDTLVGGSGNDTLDGGFGNDTLSGGDGDDQLEGGPGADVLYGGAGNDTLSGQEFEGGPGADLLYGGSGNDSFYVDGVGDIICEFAGEGFDEVVALGSYYLWDNVEALNLADFDDGRAVDFFGVGNAADNIIYGNMGSNLLIGGAGNDGMRGGDGNDQLFGESGDDNLFGDAGVDYIVGGAGKDYIEGNADADALYGEDGDDLLDGGDSFSTDILVGGAGNDTLDGASGLGDYDLLNGGAGNDVYYVDTPDDLTFEAAGEGVDTVHANINGAGYYLYAFTENLILEGNTPFGVGNELANQLTGNAIGNYLLGGLGADTLNGKGGNDVLFGEAGADIFVFERGTGGDVIGDFQAGTDKIQLLGLGFTDYAALQPNIFQVGGNSGINLGQGDFIVLNGVTNAQLSAADFLFG